MAESKVNNSGQIISITKITITTISLFPNQTIKSGAKAKEGNDCNASKIGSVILSTFSFEVTISDAIRARDKAIIYEITTLTKLSPNPRKNSLASSWLKPKNKIKNTKIPVINREILARCFFLLIILNPCV